MPHQTPPLRKPFDTYKKRQIQNSRSQISATMTAPAELKQGDMFQSIGDRVNEVSSGGNNEENFTVDEPQIVDNIGIYVLSFMPG